MKTFEHVRSTSGSQRDWTRSFIREWKRASASESCPHLNSLLGKKPLHVAHGEFTEVKNASSQHGIGPSFEQHIRHVLERTRAAARDDRHTDGLADAPGDDEIETGLGPVRVDAVEHDLASAERNGFLRPLDGVKAGGLASASGED